ncbi:MAG: ATP synthase F1 subunit delta [Flavobacteriaceae bacterium]|nr:ATP synthase F1 subunit delta [Flavobacteriaceae bacterium]
MAGTRAAIRYAKAVLSLATEQNVADAVNNDMKLITSAISENEDLGQVLKSSVIKSEIKTNILTQIFPNINGVSSSLFEVLVSNKRINILEDVAAKYTVLFDAQIGKEHATVTTAVPMTDDLEVKILSKIKMLTNKAVELNNIVDESILGGFILRVGDKQYNASIADKLNKLRREFTLN